VASVRNELQRCVVDAGEDVEGSELCWIGMGLPTPPEGLRRRAIEDRVRPDLVHDVVGRGHGDFVGLQPGEDAEYVAETGGVVQHAEADRVATTQPCGRHQTVSRFAEGVHERGVHGVKAGFVVNAGEAPAEANDAEVRRQEQLEVFAGLDVALCCQCEVERAVDRGAEGIEAEVSPAR
jgi:hypothetical protein